MDRILTHPILGDTPEGRLVNFTYDGQTLQGIEGEPIAAAIRLTPQADWYGFTSMSAGVWRKPDRTRYTSPAAGQWIW